MELGAASVRPEAGGDRALTGRLAAITGAAAPLSHAPPRSDRVLLSPRRPGDLPAQSLRIIFGTIAAGVTRSEPCTRSLLRAGASPAPLAYAQIVLDQVTWTAIVYVTGGATSGATSFYALTCLVGSILIGLRGATVGALSGVALYATLCVRVRLPLDRAAHGSTGGVRRPDRRSSSTRSSSTRSASGSSRSSRGTSPSVSGSRAARSRRRRAERNRPSASRCSGRVAAGLAHEIRNPLGSISGSIEMLRESPHLSDEDQAALRRSSSARRRA